MWSRRTPRVTDEPAVRLTALGLAAGRLVIGAGLWLAPRRSLAALGFAEIDSTAVALARIAATRDLVLGAWQLRSLGDPRELRRASAAVAVADAGDALTFGIALRAGAANRTAGLRGLAGAVPAAIAGAWLESRLRPHS